MKSYHEGWELEDLIPWEEGQAHMELLTRLMFAITLFSVTKALRTLLKFCPRYKSFASDISSCRDTPQPRRNSWMLLRLALAQGLQVDLQHRAQALSTVDRSQALPEASQTRPPAGMPAPHVTRAGGPSGLE